MAVRIVTQPREGSVTIEALLLAARGVYVTVGVHPDRKDRSTGEKNNADLLYIHTEGSPLRNIPPRPIIEPALEQTAVKDQIRINLSLALRSAKDKNRTRMLYYLQKAGRTARDACKDWFFNQRNGWEPLKKETVKRKKSAQPLIDTHELFNSIDYKVHVD